MKKMFFILIFVLFPFNVFADSYYINKNNIEMNYDEYNNLVNLGFNENEIYNMSLEEYNYNYGLNAVSVSSDSKYFKTIVLYETEDDLNNLNEDAIIEVFSEEVTEDEYLNSENLMGNISYFGNGVDTAPATVNYKKLTTSISKVGSNYRFKNSLDWKKMPKVRSHDLSGIAIGTINVTPVSGSQKSYYNYTFYNECSKTYAENQINYSSTSYWNRSSDGYYMTYPLKADWVQNNYWDYNNEECPCVDEPEYINNLTFKTDVKVTKMSHYMYYDVKKSSNSIVINALDAYGEYQHSVKSVSLSASLSFGWKSFGIDLGINYVDSYDNMEGTHAELTGISW